MSGSLHHGRCLQARLHLPVLILPDNEATIMEDKSNVLIKAASVNVEPFWPGLFARALASVNVGSLICNVGAGGPVPVAGTAPAERNRVEAKKKEFEESDDDMGFGLLD